MVGKARQRKLKDRYGTYSGGGTGAVGVTKSSGRPLKEAEVPECTLLKDLEGDPPVKAGTQLTPPMFKVVFDKSVRKFAIWRNPGSVTHRKPDWVKDESYVRVDSLKKKKR